MTTHTELEPEVVQAIQSGRKIDAIKKLRALRGIGLKEAKELVDLYAAQHNITDPSVQKVNAGNGFVLLVVLGVAGYFLYKYFS